MEKKKNITHLRSCINKTKGICGVEAPVYSTPKLFYVSCTDCLERVISKRIKEITLLQDAISKKQCVSNLKKVDIADFTIRI